MTESRGTWGIRRCAGGWDRSSSTNAWPTRGDGRRMPCDRRASAALLFAMATIATSQHAGDGELVARLREPRPGVFHRLIGVELALVMLAAPAATAGAICLDRARGTLAHMLMTDLSDPEIVLGKLAARLLPVLGLVACTWPVMAISSLLGGIDPIALTSGAIAIIVAVAVLGCTMALALLGLGQEVARSDSGDLYRLYPGRCCSGRSGTSCRWPGGSARLRRLDASGQPVLCGVRPLRRPGQARRLGLSRLLRRGARSLCLVDRARGLADAAGRLPRFGREEQGTANRPRSAG